MCSVEAGLSSLDANYLFAKLFEICLHVLNILQLWFIIVSAICLLHALYYRPTDSSALHNYGSKIQVFDEGSFT